MANDIKIVVAAQVNNAIGPLKQVEKQVGRVDASMGRSTAALRQNAAATGVSNQAMQRFAKGGLQQVGYQVGDFAVQVGGGTSALQAFGQQGSQLLGVFGPVGALLGAGVAIISAVAVAFQKSRTGAKDLTDSTEKLTAAFSSYTSAAKAALETQEDLTEEYGKGAEAQRIYLQNERRIARRDASRAFAEQISQLQSQFQLATKVRDLIAEEESKPRGFFNLSPFGRVSTAQVSDAIARSLGATEEQVFSITRSIEDLNNSTTLFLSDAEAGYNSQIASFINISNILDNILSTNNDLSNSERERLEELEAGTQAAITAIRDQLYLLDATTEETEEASKAAKKLSDELISVRETLNRPGSDRFQLLQRLQEELAIRRGGGTDVDVRIAEVAHQAGEAARSFNENRRKLLQEAGRPITGLIDVQEYIERQVEVQRNIERVTFLIDEQKNAVEKTTHSITLFGQEFEIAEEASKSLAKTIDNQMTDAFMSIVDGTKSTQDAFKSMAQAILKDLYNVLVVQRIVGSAANGTGLSGGIAKAIGLRAMGGPVTGGRPYIVGERGPELMVPNRGGQVIPNSDLGGGVTVVQNFSIAANGDDSVKRIVMQQAPQIANMAKSAVIDARRRGGQMKAAFG